MQGFLTGFHSGEGGISGGGTCALRVSNCASI